MKWTFFKKRKYVTSFLAGVVLGILLYFTGTTHSPINFGELGDATMVPALPLIYLTWFPVHWFCYIFSGATYRVTEGLCFGLHPFYDITLFIGYTVTYGIVVVLAYALWQFVKKRRNKIAPR